jgi:Mrp family chromosome partitioning ATPase
MAERLRRDIVQYECKTLVFVGIGPASTTQETILYAATLLAEREQQSVLLIDADPARRSLTTGLEFETQRGLTELLSSDDQPRNYCQLTAVGRLSFLPAGLARHTDLSAAGPPLELTLEKLAAEFSCLLIAGGTTSDLAATALARQADATYLVVQLGAVEASEAQAALRDFRAAGARVLGCIAT